MPGIAGVKFTFAELLKIAAYALEHRIEPMQIITEEEAAKFNKHDRMLFGIFGIKPSHTWAVGDRYYLLPCKGSSDNELAQLRTELAKAPSGMNAEDVPAPKKKARKKGKAK